VHPQSVQEEQLLRLNRCCWLLLELPVRPFAHYQERVSRLEQARCPNDLLQRSFRHIRYRNQCHNRYRNQCHIHYRNRCRSRYRNRCHSRYRNQCHMVLGHMVLGLAHNMVLELARSKLAQEHSTWLHAWHEGVQGVRHRNACFRHIRRTNRRRTSSRASERKGRHRSDQLVQFLSWQVQHQ
jgi:hypothetical protein